MIENKYSQLTKYLRFDNGKELVNEELRRWAAEKGIIIETTAPYSPSQNGVAKRFNCMLLELAHAMLFEKNSFGTRQWHMQHIYVTEHQYEPLMEQHHLKPGQRRNLVWDTYTHLAAMFGFLMNLKNRSKLSPRSNRMKFTRFWMDRNQFTIIMQPPGQSKCHKTLHSMKMMT